MQLSDVSASLRRHWPLALVLIVLIPIVVTVYLATRHVVRPPARYTTSADVLIPAADQRSGEAPAGVPPVLLQGQTQLATSVHTVDVALSASHLPIPSPTVHFNASLSTNDTIITLSVSAPKPETAATALANFVVAYQDGRRQSVQDAALTHKHVELVVIRILNVKLNGVLAQLGTTPLPPLVADGVPVVPPDSASTQTILLLYERNTILNELIRRQQEYAIQSTAAVIPGSYTTVVQIRSAARITPPPPSQLTPVLGIIIVGLLLAGAAPILVDRFDPSITDVRTASTALRARVLGTIPGLPRGLRQEYAPRGSPWESAFRSLAATSISTDRLPKAILVTSPDGIVHDAVAANFAMALADLGLRVALIGTVPRQQWFLETEPAEGTGAGVEPTVDSTSFLAERLRATTSPAATVATAPVVRTFPELLDDAQAGRLAGVDVRNSLAPTREPNLHVLPPGETESDISLDGLPSLLEALQRDDFDIAVVAGPALLDDPNATIIAWSTRNVMWALELGHLNARSAQLAADRLEIAGVEPFGIAVVNRRA